MNIALILAGGTGTRLGAELPKQYINVNNQPIIYYALHTLEQMEEIHSIWIVAEDRWRDLIKRQVGEKLKGFSQPGETRQLSIWSGLQDISDFAARDDVVVIHDAARPLVTASLVRECLQACENHDGALPVLSMKDTVYLGENGKITSLLDRGCVFAGQAPEAFKFEKYYQATKRLLPKEIYKINGSTEPAVLAGMDIALVEGDEMNQKITTKEDLEQFRRMMEGNS